MNLTDKIVSISCGLSIVFAVIWEVKLGDYDTNKGEILLLLVIAIMLWIKMGGDKNDT